MASAVVVYILLAVVYIIGGLTVPCVLRWMTR